MRSFLLCLPIVFFSSCSNSEPEKHETPEPPAEKILIVENGVYDCTIKDQKPIVYLKLEVDSSGKLDDFSQSVGLKSIPGTVVINDTLFRLSPVIEHSIEYGFYDYQINRKGNVWELTYQSYTALDALDSSYHTLSTEIFTRDMRLDVMDFEDHIEFQYYGFSIQLGKQIKSNQ